ncbi:MAG: hypothetical protein GSR79_00635 [Desulfurococcales archaeon]|nr:hypothetical protein [Desulfurococcales archaeon]
MLDLARTGRLRDAILDFKQSNNQSLATFDCKTGLCSLWYEFDMNPHTICAGRLWNENARKLDIAFREFYERLSRIINQKKIRRIPLRPDIVVLSGGATCNELAEGFRVMEIIECKNQDYEYWSRSIDIQILPYKEIFQPDQMIVASMKKVANHVKNHLKEL